MATEGPQTTIAPPPPPPAPKAPPLPSCAKKQTKFDEATQAEIDRLKQVVVALNARIEKGDKTAELEYDQLKKDLVDKLAAFNKSVVTVIDERAKSLEELLKTKTQILEQEAAGFENRTQEILRQQAAFQAQQARFSKLTTPDAQKLIAQIIELSSESGKMLAKIKAQSETRLPALLAEKEHAMAAYNKAKEELMIAHKQRDKLTALSQAVPARVKVKQEVARHFEINFAQWVESQLLGGIFLQYLKTFTQRESDAEVIGRCMALTNPQARKVLPCLSLNVMLGIAAGVIVRPSEKAYNDAMPLKDSLIDNSKQWLLAELLNDFFAANPDFKQALAHSFNVDANDMPAILREFNAELNKAVMGAQPKETPKIAPVSAPVVQPQMPAVQLRKAPATQPRRALPAIAPDMLAQWKLKKGQQGCQADAATLKENTLTGASVAPQVAVLK